MAEISMDYTIWQDVAAYLALGAVGVAFCWASVKLGRWPWEPRLVPRRKLCGFCEGIGRTWVGGQGDVGDCPRCDGVGSLDATR